MEYAVRPLWKDFVYFSHQLEGIQWMLQKEIEGTVVPNRNLSANVTVRGGFQCDDMGLGKTIQIAAVMYNNIMLKTLLIAPLAMLSTWSDVCKRMGMHVYEVENGEWVCKSDPNVSVPVRFIKKHPAVYITNYEKMYNSRALFLKPLQPWDRIVLDEAHKIRNGDSELALVARKIVAPIRWAVTGTPLVNSESDIVSLLAFVGVPYSPLWSWEERYLSILPNILIHRSLASLRAIIKGAPPVPEINHLVLPFVTKEEEEFYFGVQGEAKAYSADTISNAEKFKQLLRLRQISIHPQVFIDAKRRESSSYERQDWNLPCTKFEKIKDIILADTTISKNEDEKHDENNAHKYIIFCQFNDEMQYLEDFLIKENLVETVFKYNGSMNQKQRTEILKQSKLSTKKTAMLLQLQAGGVGLNLQEYDRIIFLSPWWTAALMDQAIARAVRMGQTKVVKVYHLELAAEHANSINIDMLINTKIDEKREQLHNIFEMCA